MVEKIQKKFSRFMYKRQYGYYPLLYPSRFIAGMVGMDTLELRRKLLLVKHYTLIMRGKIDSPDALSRIGISVPKLCVDTDRGLVAPRRRPRLFNVPVTRTRNAQNCPTIRALTSLNALLAKKPHIDVFVDSMAQYILEVYNFLSHSI
ncbi:uncharacterized protein LOC114363224 [Ostrinia furnacalis]|uniref:uncharacterized protein LOC114363224 n=1 Tax=Ostrinia furnacalis TaxID=93504 RepID=UPI0010400DD4|nr:uncharacterized protein LOC114363224 [Ostrinia furnacalis]